MLDEALKSTSHAVAAVTGILVNISDISSSAGGQSPEPVINTTTAMSAGLSTTLSPTAAKYATSKWFYFTESPELVGSQLEQSVVPVEIWKSFQVVHTIMMIMALLLNCLSLGIIYGIVPKLTPPLQLLTSLAFAEMLAPWAIMTMYFPASSCQDEIHSALLLTAHNASAVTLIGLAFSHNVATFRPLQYERIVSQKRLWIFINVVWISSIITAHIHFLAVLSHHDPSRHFCIQVLEQTNLALMMSGALSTTLAIFAGLIYTRIFVHLRPIHTFADPANLNEPRKCIRGIVTGILVTATFLLAWVPYLITKYVQVRDNAFMHKGILIGLDVCQVMILLNCVSEPILCGLRMSSLQNGYLAFYHKCRGWAVVTWHRVSKHVENDEQPSTPLNPIESIC